MSSDDQSDKECPLCMEAFDYDDLNFYPCNCQYQICRFCWHRIRTNENGLCPACRQSYPEDPVNFQPLTTADVQKIKSEKKQKLIQQKNKLSETRKHLTEFRVLQKNLIYVIGLSQRMADQELLKKPEFFGKFGKIVKVAVGTIQPANSTQPISYTAYVTYTRMEDALKAIQAVNNVTVNGRSIKASLGTTKYCSNFLKGQPCHKQECMYLHEVADEEISFTKDDMHQGKHTEYERKLHEQSKQSAQSQQQQQQQSNSVDLAKAKSNRESKVNKPEKSSGVQQPRKNGWGELQKGKTVRNISTSSENRKNQYGKAVGGNKPKHGQHKAPGISSSEDNGHQIPLPSNPNSDNTTEDEYTPPMKTFASCEQMETIDSVVVLAEDKSSSSSVSPNPQLSSHSSTQLQKSHSSDNTSEPLTSSHNQANNINFFVDQDQDDELGFDPFSESVKALADMLEEEKSFGYTNGFSTDHHRSPVTTTTSSNFGNAFGEGLNSTSHFSFPFLGERHQSPVNSYSSHQQQRTTLDFPPPGLPPPSFSGFSPFGHHLQSSGPRESNMDNEREGFKALLPNVNVRFVSESDNLGRQHGYDFLACLNSRNSSRSLLSSSVNDRDHYQNHQQNAYNHHPFLDPPLPTPPKHFASLNTPPKSSYVPGFDYGVSQHNNQQQQIHLQNNQSQSRQPDTGQGHSSSWLPVPPGFGFPSRTNNTNH